LKLFLYVMLWAWPWTSLQPTRHGNGCGVRSPTKHLPPRRFSYCRMSLLQCIKAELFNHCTMAVQMAPEDFYMCHSKLKTSLFKQNCIKFLMSWNISVKWPTTGFRFSAEAVIFSHIHTSPGAQPATCLESSYVNTANSLCSALIYRPTICFHRNNLALQCGVMPKINLFSSESLDFNETAILKVNLDANYGKQIRNVIVRQSDLFK
jgi:hypothetical protein